MPTTQSHRFWRSPPPPPVLLRRKQKALQPTAHAGLKKKKPRGETKEDPNHPLCNGGVRKQVWAPRPARVKGSRAWAARQLDPYQRRTLRIAFKLYESKTHRLKYCKQLREHGTLHKHCPLEPLKGSSCTDDICTCKPAYRVLVGKDGGMGTGEPEFVSDLFARWRAEKKQIDKQAAAASASAAIPLAEVAGPSTSGDGVVVLVIDDAMSVGECEIIDDDDDDDDDDDADHVAVMAVVPSFDLSDDDDVGEEATDKEAA